MLFVVLSAVSFMISWVNEGNNIKEITNLINTIFVYAFTFEAFLKIYVYGASFFRDIWNVFDLIVIMITTGGVIRDYFSVFSNFSSLAQFFILLRITRVFRIIK